MEKFESFIVTGASASGKTTLVRHARNMGYAPLPTHTSRPLRPGEAQGVDMFSLPEADFIRNFNDGYYLEPSLSFARLDATGIFYGTPRLWVPQLTDGKTCAMPTSLTVAKALQDASGALWVHLECPPDVRKQRLQERNISAEEVTARMTNGESIYTPRDAEVVIDTSHFTVEAILNVIKDL